MSTSTPSGDRYLRGAVTSPPRRPPKHPEAVAASSTCDRSGLPFRGLVFLPGTRRDPARHGITHATRIAFFSCGGFLPYNPLRAIILSTFKYFNVVHLEGKKVFFNALSQHVKFRYFVYRAHQNPALLVFIWVFEKELEQVIRSTFKYFIVVLSRDEPRRKPFTQNLKSTLLYHMPLVLEKE